MYKAPYLLPFEALASPLRALGLRLRLLVLQPLPAHTQAPVAFVSISF